MAAGRTYTPIAKTILSNNSATITFSSISGSYTDLILVTSAFLTEPNSQTIWVRFNDDSGSNYSYTQLYGTGSVAASSRENNLTKTSLANRANPIDSLQDGIGIAQFMNYSNSTTHKRIISRGGNANEALSLVVSSWRSTAAITKIELFPGDVTYSFRSGSTFTLYGIAAA